MLTKRRLSILCSAILAVAIIFIAYKQTRASSCVPMSHRNVPVDPQLIDGNTAFAFKLYRAVATDTTSNFVYSPYSISELLAMLELGADGQTAAQIASGLHFTLPQDQLHSAFHALDNNLVNNAQDSEGTWCNANALWVDKHFELSSMYLEQVKKLYNSDVQFADFRSNAAGARNAINQWVQNQTKDRIKDFFPLVNSDTGLVLANAVYFKNNWEIPFPKSSTHDDKFTLLNGQGVAVPMMKMDGAQDFGYFKGNDYQMIELPYKGQHISLVIIMPAEGHFETVQTAFDPDQLKRALASSKAFPLKIKVSIPRFQFQYELPLTPILQGLGVKDAFDPASANFAKLLSTDSTPLYVQQVLHRAFINVDESGTEAAAASGAAIPVILSKSPEIKVDHPFIFAIRDKETETILFLGRVLNPLH